MVLSIATEDRQDGSLLQGTNALLIEQWGKKFLLKVRLLGAGVTSGALFPAIGETYRRITSAGLSIFPPATQ